jgi:hypothetical protein
LNFGFFLRRPMLRRAFRYHASGALEAFPCIGV